jgi:FkbM family methyltransferase
MKYTYWNPDLIKDYHIKMRGVIHIGAHNGLEYEDYVLYGIQNIIFFEPVASTYQKLLARLPNMGNEFVTHNLCEEPLPYVRTVNMALGNTTGEIEMFIETANNGQSSSILEAGTHLQSYPQITFDTKETVKIDKLDNINFPRALYNVLNVDVQGYELEVFKGAVNVLKTIDVIYTEINTGEVYKGCAKLSDLDEFLSTQGFTRVWVHVYEGVGYGDAIYVKNDFNNKG